MVFKKFRFPWFLKKVSKERPIKAKDLIIFPAVIHQETGHIRDGSIQITGAELCFWLAAIGHKLNYIDDPDFPPLKLAKKED